MGFGDAVRVCMQEKYASFSGRATRAEYWYFFLFMVLVLFCGALAGLFFLGFALSRGAMMLLWGFSLLSMGFWLWALSVRVYLCL